MTKPDITNEASKSARARGRGSAGRGRFRGVKKNISGSWSVGHNSKLDNSNASKDTTSIGKRSSNFNGSISKRAKVN